MNEKEIDAVEIYQIKHLLIFFSKSFQLDSVKIAILMI
jgi:hypothetical protein